jgi:TP901 family phage tail tape measure protein
MAKIDLNIVATGEFSQVTTQIKALQAQVDVLNKSVAGVGVGAAMAKDIQLASAAFKSTMLSTGQFTMSTVKMTSETEKFGQALVAGKLRLNDYFQIITGKAGQATASLAALTAEQVKLQESVVMTDPTRRGFLQVYTPTTINSVTAATKMATMQQNLYNLSIESGSKALITWGKNTQWAGRQLTVGLTMPMVLFGAAAVKSFKDANVELTRLQRLYGVGLIAPTQEQLNKISDQVMNLSKKIASDLGIAQKETLATAADFAAIGRTGDDLLTATEQAMRLSKLGSIDAHQAFTGIMTLQNTFKVSSSDLAEGVNFMSAIQKQTALNLNDITDAFPRIGPIVKQLGGTYKDTAVMMLAMKEAGVPAAQAANAIKSAMASLISPTTAAKDMFAKFNINLGGIAKSTGGNPVLMIQSLQKSLEGIAPLAREQLIEKLFGKFQFARITALLDNLGKAGSQTQLGFKIASASASELSSLINQEMKIATESTTAKFQRALEGFKATLYPIGQEFMKIGTIILDIANKVGKAFSGLPGPVKTVLGIMAGFALFAGPVIMLTGLLANFGGYILKTVVGIKQLATGGKSFKELLTPEIIASTNAAQLFDGALSNDISAVDLLNVAIKNLTTSIESMNAVMASTGAGGLAGLTKNVETAAAARAMSQPFLPGFANGVFSLQAGGPKGKDTIPALIGRGESVVSAPMTEKHSGLLKAIINDEVPGFDSGVYGAAPLGNVRGGINRGVNSLVINSNTQQMQALADRVAVDTRVSSIRQAGLGLNAGLSSETIGRGGYNPSAVADKAWESLGAERQALMQFAEKAQLSETQTKNLLEVQASHIEKDTILVNTQIEGLAAKSKVMNVFRGSNLVPDLGAVNNYMEKVNPAVIDEFQASMKGNTAKLDELGISEEQLNVELARVKAGMHVISEAGMKTVGALGAFDYAKTGNYMGGAAATVANTRNMSYYNNMVTPQGTGKYYDTSQDATRYETTLKQAQSYVAKMETVGAQFNRTVWTEIVEKPREMLRIASPSKVTEELIGVPAVEGVIQGIQATLPGLEAAGTEVANTLTTAMDQKIISNGSEMHMLLLTQAGEVVNTSIDFNKAGQTIGEAQFAGYKQAMLPFEAYVQETLPGMAAAGAAAAAKSSIAYGPLLPNGAMSLGRRERLINGEVIKPPLVNRGVGFGLSMGAMMAAPMVGNLGGGNNQVAKTAGSVLSNVGMAAMLPMMIPALAGSLMPLIGGVAVATLAFKGISMAIAKEKEERNSMIQSYQATGEAIKYFGLNVGSLASYDFSKAGSGLDAHVKSISDNKVAVDALTQAYLNSTDQMTKDRVKNLKGMDSKQLTYEMSKQYASDIAAGMTGNQAQQDINALLKATGASFVTQKEVNDKIARPENVSAAFAANIKNAATKYDTYTGQVVSANDLDSRANRAGGKAPLAFSPESKAQAANRASGAKEGDKSFQQSSAVVDNITSSLQNLAAAGVTQVNAAFKDFNTTAGKSKAAALNTNQIYKAYRDNLEKQAKGLGAVSDKFRKANGTTAQLVEATSLMTSKLVTQKQITDALNSGPSALTKLWNDYKDKVMGLEAKTKPTVVDDSSTTSNAATFTGTTAQKNAEKALKANLKQQDALLKTMKDQLSLQQKQTAEIKRQNDFAQQTLDLNTQMKTDMISGNYLGAAGLKQQISSLSVDFNAGTQQYKMQTQIDTMQSRADMFNQALADLTEAISQSSSVLSKDVLAASKTGSIKGSSVDTSIPSSGVITQNFVINGGDINAVHKTVTEATKQASGKSVATKFKAGVNR